MIEDQLPAARLEGFEVALRCVQYFRGLLISRFHRLIDIGVLVIPVRLSINEVGEVSVAEREQQALLWLRPGDPRLPSSGPLLRSRDVPRKNLSPFGVVGPFVQFFQCGHLRCRQALQ